MTESREPRNVLLGACRDESTGGLVSQIKLLDFGLAVAKGANPPSGELMGTLPYMAPELFRGEGAGTESDLYAVGVIAYELLVGRHPFARHREAGLLLRAILEESPDLSPLSAWPQLQALIGRLLAKDPAQRAMGADQVAQRLLAEQPAQAVMESASVRDSFLFAARFIGRKQELKTLTESVDRALRGQGEAWLIGGESGVGKSRLLEELRSHALVEGMRVLRGQAVQERSLGLELFREVIRALSLSVPLSEQEESVLKGVASDLPQLLGKEIPDPPLLDPGSTRRRLLDTTLAVLLRNTDPLLLFLEDLHWVDEDTVELLGALIKQLGSRQLLVVGSYRNDECQDLPLKLPGAKVLPLRRLDPDEVTELTVSMLGEAAVRRDLQSLVQQETEGNTFFVVEVVRALAEEAGGLRAVAERTLPRRVVTGGIDAMVRRRLRRVPEAAREMLRVAAVAGRELDLAVLRTLEPRADRYLQICADASILEVEDVRWRFSHSKIREGVLSDLSDDEKIDCHLRLAETIERVYMRSPSHAATLGFHYERARQPQRAIPFYGAAGAAALRSGLLREAKEHLQRAADLQKEVGCKVSEQAVTLRRLAQALHGLGQPEECAQVLGQAMALVGTPLPKTRAARGLAIASELFTEAKTRIFGIPKLHSEEQRALKQEQLNLLLGTGDSLFVSKAPRDIVFYTSLCGLHVAEQLGDVRQQAQYLAMVGYTSSLFAPQKLSQHYLERAQRLAKELSVDQPLMGFHCYSALCFHASGDFDKALHFYRAAVADAKRRGDEGQEALMMLLLVAGLLERHDLAEIDRLGQRVASLGLQMGNRQLEASGYGWRAIAALFAGNKDAAFALFAQATSFVFAVSSRAHRLSIHGSFALSALRIHDVETCVEHCERALALMDQGLVPAPSFRIGYSSVLMVCFGLWERAESSAQQAAALRRCLRALGHMMAFGFVFPIGRPWALLGAGRLLQKLGLDAVGRLACARAQLLAAQLAIPLAQQAGPELLSAP